MNWEIPPACCKLARVAVCCGSDCAAAVDGRCPLASASRATLTTWSNYSIQP